MIQKPEKHEYNAYFQRYIDLVPEGSFSDLFKRSTDDLVRVFSQIPDGMHNYRYAENKWTIKAMLMHIIDTERVFSYRMLVAARNDATTPLQRMDESFYAAHVDVSLRSMESLLEEFSIVRKSMFMLISNLNEDQSSFLANAISYKVSARALAYITMGHGYHHIKILRERYLSVQH